MAQVKSTSVANEIAVIKIDGTGAAINVPIGFIPSKVEVLNLTTLAKITWFKGMTAAHAFVQITAGTLSLVTTAGITAYEGGTTEAAGVTLGTNANLNTSGNVIWLTAYR